MRYLAFLLLLAPAWARMPASDPDTPDADAARLFDDGQAMLHAGRYGAATVTFRTLLYVYPESALATQAREALRQSEDQEAKVPSIRALTFHLGKTVSPEEIQAYFAAREVALWVERPYDARDVERARLALQALLASKGKKGTIKAEVRPIKPRNVQIDFTFEKK
jgi:NAD(P)H-dependent flavin oxidoreductase YrpB (nitropropane dioxygenase family)